MFSITGYFLAGSKSRGRTITPQMSVLPSRPLATNSSGGLKPAAVSSEMSPRSIVARPASHRSCGAVRTIWAGRRANRCRHNRPCRARRRRRDRRRAGVMRRQVAAVEVDAVVVLQVGILAWTMPLAANQIWRFWSSTLTTSRTTQSPLVIWFFTCRCGRRRGRDGSSRRARTPR